MAHRPSKLVLDQYATGELDEIDAKGVEAFLDDRSRKHLDAIEAAKQDVPPLDIAALRARAAEMPETIEDDAYAGADAPMPPAVAPPSVAVAMTEPPPAANRRSVWRWLAPAGLLVAAALALFLVVPTVPSGVSPPDIAVRGGGLQVYLADEGRLQPYVSGTPVGQGDRLGFQVLATGRGAVVLLSVDGFGAVSVHWPAEGIEPEALAGSGMVPLEGTLVLDHVPGPETFVAVFDTPADDATTQVRAAFAEGRHAGLRRWAAQADHVSVVEVTRK